MGKDLLSAEEALNVPGFQLGTAIRGGIERFGDLPQRVGLPGVGGLLGTGFDIGLAPATIIPGFTGGRLSVAAGRALGPRLGAEVATALGAAGAGGATALGLREAERRGLPVPGFVQTLAPIAAAVAGGLRVASLAKRGSIKEVEKEIVRGLPQKSIRITREADSPLGGSLSAGLRFAGETTSTPEAIGRAYSKKQWFHGSGRAGLRADQLDPWATDPQSLFGTGIYLTDSRNTARGYALARGRRTQTPTLYEAEITVNRVLDLEGPLPDDVRAALLQNFQPFETATETGEAFNAISVAMREALAQPSLTGEQFFERLGRITGDISAEFELPASEFADSYQNITILLAESGIDALTHTGGQRTGNAAHRVMILLNPSDIAAETGTTTVRSFAEISLDKVGAEVFQLTRGGVITERATRFDAPVGSTARAVQKITGVLEEATPIRAETLAKQSAERGVRAAQMEAFTRGLPGDLTEAAARERGKFRAGPLPKGTIEPIRGQFTDDEVTALIRGIEEYAPLEQLSFERQGLLDDLWALLDEGVIPTAAPAARFDEIFGSGFTQALRSNLPKSQQLRAKFYDLLGVPRSIVTSADISPPFRQGLLTAFSGRGPRIGGVKVIPLPNPTFWGAWKPMLRAFKSEEFAQAELVRVSTRSGIGVSEKAGLSRTRFGATAQLEDREEQFRSSIAETIPLLGRLIRASNRAYTTFLNRLRADMFDDYAAELTRVGQGTDANFKALATAMNTLTGRGKIPGPRALEQMLNVGLFAPQFVFSKFRTPVDLARAPAAIRRQMAADVVGTFAAVSSGLALLKLSGLADVELNPKSSDFGKARFGNVRIDPWGGFQPIARYLAQIVTGERKATGSGDIREVGRIETAEKFLESKLAPVPGALLDLIRGRTFLGEEVEFGAKPEFDDVLTSRLVPFILQDINDAMIERGMLGAALGFPGLVGFGVQAFTTRADLQNELAAAEFGKPWDQITGEEQQALELSNEESFERIRIRSDFDNTRDEINDSSRAAELELSKALESGFDPRQVNQALSDVSRERQIRTNQAFKDFGFASQDDDDVVSTIFAKREEAVRFGIVDFQALDQITEDELAKLTPDQRRLWDQRRRFIHDPSVQHIFASKDLIADSGYWQLQRDAFERFAFQIVRIDPGIQTYQQLDQAIRIADSEGNTGRARRLNGIKRRIDTRTARTRKTARRKDRLLDQALVTVYGLQAVR